MNSLAAFQNSLDMSTQIRIYITDRGFFSPPRNFLIHHNAFCASLIK